MSDAIKSRIAARNEYDGYPQPLTRLELAAFLKLSPRTIDRYVASRRIPFIKIGKTLRFQLADVHRALKRFTVEEVNL